MATAVAIPQAQYSLLTDPGLDGTLLISDSSMFEMAAVCYVTATGQPPKFGQVVAIPSPNSVKLGRLSDGGPLDLTAFRQFDGAAVTMPAQSVASVNSASDPELVHTVTTGVTVNANQRPTRVLWKATILPAAWGVAAALTADVSLCTIPAKALVQSVIADTTVAFTGLAGTIQLKVGKTTGGNEYVLAHDVKSAPITKGIADADLGAALSIAAGANQGDIASWSAGTIVKARLTSGTGNIGDGALSNITAGTVVVYVVAELLP